jgi:bifunctional oligoribonuclease and PAP phosphatase NrnA
MTDTQQQIQKLRGLIDSSQRILITSHISPDPDAVSSSLLLYHILKTNFPNKETVLVLEEEPTQDLKFLEGYKVIEFKPLLESAQGFNPDLLIIVDASGYSRVSRNQGNELRELISKGAIHTAVIDHHEPSGKDATDVYINNQYPASAQEVYHVFFDKLGLHKPSDYAQITLVGILSDTMRFKYANPKHRETFSLVSDLIDAGADIEKLESRIEAYTAGQLEVLAHIIGNMKQSDGYNYSFVTDDFAERWHKDNKELADFSGGIDMFKNQFVRYIAPNNWGFIVYPELVPSERNYSVSLRSLGDNKDVAVIAAALGGGGHKPAAGAKFKAGSLDQALETVRNTISSLALK